MAIDWRDEIKDLALNINGSIFSYSQWSGVSSGLVILPGANNFISTKRTATLKAANFIKNQANIDVTIEARDAAKKILASRRMTIPVKELSSGDTKTITLNTNSSKAQYMTVNNYHVRLNTLFARQLVERANVGIDTILTMTTQRLQEPGLNNSTPVPMDFSGANALYFWELFYYTPVLIARRFLQEQRFTEATRWLKYVFSPAGYIVGGEHESRSWNVRPLEEDTTWNDDPLDSVDPDAVAQNDPMHYKVATFMQALDQLMARGDSAYRLLERDALNEAKMWYAQALDLLGEQPEVNIGSAWTSPRLDDAASDTTALIHERDLLALRSGVGPRTANSLVGLFLPEMNDKLQGYWDTLAQRMYNLRHNLSIDGQPLSPAIYASPADPAALLSAAATISSGGDALPVATMPLYRFPVMLESARTLVGQLSQFGATLQGITERQDAEALEKLLQVQGSELMLMTLAQQEQVLVEIDADKRVLEETRHGVQKRFDSYAKLYDEDVNAGEEKAMGLYLRSSVLVSTAMSSHTIAASLDAVPNIYGMAFGGSRYGSIARAVGTGIEVLAEAYRLAADKISQSEAYRRRRQEWEIQRNQAESDLKQLDAQLDSVAIRRQAALLQKTLLETQQGQIEAQLAFLQTKFTSQALYNWLRGKLAAIYYQFYDLTVSRCLMAQETYRWDRSDAAASFIKPGAWQGTYAGLLAGETLMLNLAQMEQSWLKTDYRELEVTRTVSLKDVYGKLSSGAFDLPGKVNEMVAAGKGGAGSGSNTLQITGTQLVAAVQLSGLKINADYPSGLGDLRLIKQISVTLPALVGPYQDVRAVLNYGGSVQMPRGCQSVAVSHGMNDSGQFVLDFNDSRYLPFEGISVTDTGSLTLSFPDATASQKAMLQSLSDIILHIRYTIRSK